jgi:hypothetical protein
MPTAVDVRVFPMCTVDATEFTFVCFWIELLQILVRQSVYVFCSLGCSAASSQYAFPILVVLGCLQLKEAGLNKTKNLAVFFKKA